MYVTPTSLKLSLVRGEEIKTKPFRIDRLCLSHVFFYLPSRWHLSSPLLPHFFFLPIFLLSPSPVLLYIPFPFSFALISLERMKPLPSTGNWMAWMETRLSLPAGSPWNRTPFPPSSFSVISIYFGLVPLVHIYFPVNWPIPHRQIKFFCIFLTTERHKLIQTGHSTTGIGSVKLLPLFQFTWLQLCKVTSGMIQLKPMT